MKKRRFLAWLMTLVMMVGLMPATVLAKGHGGGGGKPDMPDKPPIEEPENPDEPEESDDEVKYYILKPEAGVPVSTADLGSANYVPNDGADGGVDGANTDTGFMGGDITEAARSALAENKDLYNPEGFGSNYLVVPENLGDYNNVKNKIVWYAIKDQRPNTGIHVDGYVLDEEETITINYFVDGDDEEANKIDTVKAGSEYTFLTAESANVSKEGYTFDGWNTEADGSGRSYNSGDKGTFVSGGTLKLYGQWTKSESPVPTTYKVVYQYDDSAPANAPNLPEEESYEKGESVTVDTTVTDTEDYTFLGWYDANDNKVTGTFEMQEGNVVLTGKWEAKEETPVVTKYTVVFYAQNGEEEPYHTQEVEVGGTATAPTTEPTLSNSKFMGWFTAADGVNGAEWDFNTAITADVVNTNGVLNLYARWDADTEKSGIDIFKKIVKIVKADKTEVTDINDETTVSVGDTVYYKVRLVNSEKFYTEGGILTDHLLFTAPEESWTFENIIVEDSLTGIENIEYVKGWLTDTTETLNGTAQSVTVVDGKITVPVNTMYQNDDVVNYEGTEINYGVTDITYTYTVKDADAGETLKNTASVGEDEEGTTVIPVNPVKVTVTFVDSDNVETVYNTQEVEVGGKATAPTTNPTKENYEFAGWYADAECETKFDFTTVIEVDTTVYADWTYVPPTPDKPETVKARLTVECATHNGTDSCQKYEVAVNVTDYTIGDVYEIGTGYAVDVTLNAPEAYYDTNHVANDAKTADTVLTYTYSETNGWTTTDNVFNLYIKANVPEAPTAVDVVLDVLCSDHIGTADCQTYDKALVATDYTVGGVYEANGVYVVDVTLGETTKYYPADHVKDTAETDIVELTFTYENNRWVTDSNNFVLYVMEKTPEIPNTSTLSATKDRWAPAVEYAATNVKWIDGVDVLETINYDANPVIVGSNGVTLLYKVTVKNTVDSGVGETKDYSVTDKGATYVGYTRGAIAPEEVDGAVTGTLNAGTSIDLYFTKTFVATDVDTETGKVTNIAKLGETEVPDGGTEVTIDDGIEDSSVLNGKKVRVTTEQVATDFNWVTADFGPVAGIEYGTPVINGPEGVTLLYKVTVTNAIASGEGTAKDYSVTDAGAIYVGYEQNKTKPEVKDGAVTGTLEVGESIDLYFTKTFVATDVVNGEVTNTANVNGKDTEPVKTTVTVENPEVPVTKVPSIDVTKTVDGDKSIRRGQWVRYEIVVKNIGEVELTNVVVTETPNDDQFEEGYFINDDGDKIKADYVTDGKDTDTYTIAKLAAGETVTLTYKAKVDSDTARGKDLINKVEVTSNEGAKDSDENDDAYVPKKSSGGSSSKKDKEVVAGDVEEILNTEDHFQYVQGYPDGTVGPERNITRAEATVIFFRLLQDHVREELLTAENNFPDVNLEDWFNLGVSTMECSCTVRKQATENKR